MKNFLATLTGKSTAGAAQTGVAPISQVVNPQKTLVEAWMYLSDACIEHVIRTGNLDLYVRERIDEKSMIQSAPNLANQLELFKQVCAGLAVNTDDPLLRDLRKRIPLAPYSRCIRIQKELESKGLKGQSEVFWAKPQELDLALRLLNEVRTPQQQTVIQSPVTQIQSLVQPAPLPITPNPVDQSIVASPGDSIDFTGQAVNASPVVSHIEQIGKAMEVAFHAHGLSGVTFCPNSSYEGLRCNQVVFRKPVASTFASVEARMEEALSNAGCPPDGAVMTTRLANNQIQVLIPRDRSTWKDAQAMSYLIQISEAISPGITAILKNQADHTRFQKAINRFHDIGRGRFDKGLSIPFAIKLDDELLWLNLSTGALIVGKSGSGKSIGMKLICLLLQLCYPEELLQIGLILDMKKGLTFSKFGGSGRIVRPIITDPDDESEESLKEFREMVKDIFAELKAEAARRAGVLKAANCENLIEYNAANPGNPIPWSPIFLDEIANYTRIMGKAGIEILHHVLSQWRAVGMPLIAGTQYGSANHGVGPDNRVNFGALIAYACNQECASLIFEERRLIRAATKLMGAGDCLIDQDGATTRAQGLTINPVALMNLITELEGLYPANHDLFN